MGCVNYAVLRFCMNRKNLSVEHRERKNLWEKSGGRLYLTALVLDSDLASLGCPSSQDHLGYVQFRTPHDVYLLAACPANGTWGSGRFLKDRHCRTDHLPSIQAP